MVQQVRRKQSHIISYTTNFMAVCGGLNFTALRNFRDRRTTVFHCEYDGTHFGDFSAETMGISLEITSRCYPWTSNWTNLGIQRIPWARHFCVKLPLKISKTWTITHPLCEQCYRRITLTTKLNKSVNRTFQKYNPYQILSAFYPFYSKYPISTFSPSGRHIPIEHIVSLMTFANICGLSCPPSLLPSHHRVGYRQITAPRMHLEWANPIPLRPPKYRVPADHRRWQNDTHTSRANDKVLRVQCRGEWQTGVRRQGTTVTAQYTRNRR